MVSNGRGGSSQIVMIDPPTCESLLLEEMRKRLWKEIRECLGIPYEVMAMSDYCQTSCEHPECIAHHQRITDVNYINRTMNGMAKQAAILRSQDRRVIERATPEHHDDLVSRICLEHFSPRKLVSSADSDAAFMTHVVEPTERWLRRTE